MNQKLLILTGILFVSFCFQSCKSTAKTIASTDTNTEPLNILLQDSSKTFHLKVNEKFDATYNECIGCAEVWKITKIDSLKIGLLSISYANKSCINCIGGNQDKTFHFIVKKTGKSVISFSYFTKNISFIIDASK